MGIVMIIIKARSQQIKPILLQKKISIFIKNEFFLPVNGSHDIFQQLKHKQLSVFTLIGEKIAGLWNQKDFSFSSFSTSCPLRFYASSYSFSTKHMPTTSKKTSKKENQSWFHTSKPNLKLILWNNGFMCLYPVFVSVCLPATKLQLSMESCIYTYSPIWIYSPRWNTGLVFVCVITFKIVFLSAI